MPDLTVEDALRAYARMLNTLDLRQLEPLLADDFHFASQMVYSEIETKSEYLAYMTGKIAAMRRAGAKVWAEMGRLETGFPGPCMVLAQGSKDALVGVVLAKVRDGKIIRIDLCIVPPPDTATRTGEYPE